jgi:hypothetical protein
MMMGTEQVSEMLVTRLISSDDFAHVFAATAPCLSMRPRICCSDSCSSCITWCKAGKALIPTDSSIGVGDYRFCLHEHVEPLDNSAIH